MSVTVKLLWQSWKKQQQQRLIVHKRCLSTNISSCYYTIDSNPLVKIPEPNSRAIAFNKMIRSNERAYPWYNLERCKRGRSRGLVWHRLEIGTSLRGGGVGEGGGVYNTAAGMGWYSCQCGLENSSRKWRSKAVTPNRTDQDFYYSNCTKRYERTHVQILCICTIHKDDVVKVYHG